MIRFTNVTKVYESTGTVALKNVSFTIEEGEFVFIVGASGAGKSTITKLVLCEEPASDGIVQVNGFNLHTIKKRKIPYLRRSVGAVYQDFRLLPDMTVYENIAFAMEAIGTPRRQIRHVVPSLLKIVGLEGKEKLLAAQLAGGEQQRVSLARALANHPSVIIADEPTGNLDPRTSKEIMYLLEDINKRGTTVIVATHAKGLVDRMKKRVIALSDGSVIRDEKEGGYGNV